MKISIIAAVAKNNVIGKDNDLIWRLPRDMKFFKETTMGHHIIMGRKNYESMGRPLPGRTNIVITRNKDFKAKGCIVVATVKEALKAVKNDDECFIIGGGQIYKQTLEIANRLYITRIDAEFEGDVFFPEIDMDKWKIVDEVPYPIDEKHKYPFTIYTMDRKI